MPSEGDLSLAASSRSGGKTALDAEVVVEAAALPHATPAIAGAGYPPEDPSSSLPRITPLPLASTRRLDVAARSPPFERLVAAAVENSVNAGASAVRVWLDAPRLAFRVDDDGRGIDIAGLSAVAEGCVPGGGYLADLGEVARVRLTSRARCGFEAALFARWAGRLSWCGALTGGHEVDDDSLAIPLGPTCPVTAGAWGSSLIVSDLWQDVLPVRAATLVAQSRATGISSAAPPTPPTHSAARRAVLHLAVAHPRVRFEVRCCAGGGNGSEGRVLLNAAADRGTAGSVALLLGPRPMSTAREGPEPHGGARAFRTEWRGLAPPSASPATAGHSRHSRTAPMTMWRVQVSGAALPPPRGSGGGADGHDGQLVLAGRRPLPAESAAARAVLAPAEALFGRCLRGLPARGWAAARPPGRGGNDDGGGCPELGDAGRLGRGLGEEVVPSGTRRPALIVRVRVWRSRCRGDGEREEELEVVAPAGPCGAACPDRGAASWGRLSDIVTALAERGLRRIWADALPLDAVQEGNPLLPGDPLSTTRPLAADADTGAPDDDADDPDGDWARAANSPTWQRHRSPPRRGPGWGDHDKDRRCKRGRGDVNAAAADAASDRAARLAVWRALNPVGDGSGGWTGRSGARSAVVSSRGDAGVPATGIPPGPRSPDGNNAAATLVDEMLGAPSCSPAPLEDGDPAVEMPLSGLLRRWEATGASGEGCPCPEPLAARGAALGALRFTEVPPHPPTVDEIAVAAGVSLRPPDPFTDAIRGVRMRVGNGFYGRPTAPARPTFAPLADSDANWSAEDGRTAGRPGVPGAWGGAPLVSALLRAAGGALGPGSGPRVACAPRGVPLDQVASAFIPLVVDVSASSPLQRSLAGGDDTGDDAQGGSVLLLVDAHAADERASRWSPVTHVREVTDGRVVRDWSPTLLPPSLAPPSGAKRATGGPSLGPGWASLPRLYRASPCSAPPTEGRPDGRRGRRPWAAQITRGRVGLGDRACLVGGYSSRLHGVHCWPPPRCRPQRWMGRALAPSPGRPAPPRRRRPS